MKDIIQSILNDYGFGISLKKLVHEVYWILVSKGYDPCIVNERYLEVNGVNYQLKKTRSKGHWTAVEF